MPFIEAPTTFYMGRRYDPTSKRLVDDVIYYDSRDLTTHAVVVGMTGSGKTGLCINLLEEAVLDNIPAIVIDPKGDITNLLLSFPELQPADFEPWVNVDDARRAGMEIHDYAADVAARWRDGLRAWGIVPDRVKWLKHAAEYSIYTPGSDAGLPISILDAMQPPPEGWFGHEEANRERISGMVKALMALIGKQVDPVKDREHVLIANIFENAWKQGMGLTLEDVIIQVQQPPFEKLGVFDIDTFFPEKERFKLAMELNNIIAAPSFQSWINGSPLDIKQLLYTPEGKARVAVFYIAHLNDAERQFIITLLLENILAWMRSLSGTTSLRALLYMDEVFGLFPPYPKNPPTKDPMLKLLKQARAFGLGLVLATQNPGDLDYKGLANAGTWFIGKLQTENDRRKMLTGLEALADSHPDFDLGDVRDLIAELDPRVFLMHNVHDEGGPTLFHTRWAMSYLRGPLTRQQVSKLMAGQRAKLMPHAVPLPGTGGYAPRLGGPTGSMPAAPPQMQGAQPPLPPGATPPPMPPQFPAGSPPPSALPEMPPQQAYPPQPPMPQEGIGGGYTQPTGGYTQPTGGYGTPPPGQTQITHRASNVPPGYSDRPPVVPSSVIQYFLPNTIPTRTAIANWERQFGFTAQGTGAAQMIYKPFLLAQATVRYQDRKTEVNTDRPVAYHVPNVAKTGMVRWEQYEAMPVDPQSLAHEPFTQAWYAELAPGLPDPKRLKELQREMVDQIYHSQSLELLYSPTLKVYSDPDANRRDFRVKLQALVREKRDAEVDKITQKYGAKLDRLEEKLRREIRELEEDQADLSDRRREQLFTAGEAALSLFRGRTTYTLSRYSRTQRYSRQASADVRESEQEIALMQDQMDQITHEMEQALQAANAKWTQVAGEAEPYRVNPLKKNIYMELFGIGWIPYWFLVLNGQPTLLPANPLAAR